MQEASEQASNAQDNVLAPVKADALDPKERSCCICLQPFGPATLTLGGSEAPVQLPCGHLFGEVCISSWTLVNNSCPLCRTQVFSFGFGDHPADRNFPNSQVSTLHSSALSPQDDIWLDENVWNNSDSRRQDTVSSIDIETLICYCTHGHSHVELGSQPQRSLELLVCGEHRGFCHCSDDQNTKNAAVPHRRLTRPATSQLRQVGIGNLEFAELGSQFAELDYRYKVWMDEFLNEPSFGESSLF